MSGPLLMRRYSTTGLLRLTNGLKAFYCLGFSCSVPATMTAIADAVRWAEKEGCGNPATIPPRGNYAKLVFTSEAVETGT